jgi:hypothetical protein
MSSGANFWRRFFLGDSQLGSRSSRSARRIPAKDSGEFVLEFAIALYVNRPLRTHKKVCAYTATLDIALPKRGSEFSIVNALVARRANFLTVASGLRRDAAQAMRSFLILSVVMPPPISSGYSG